MANSESVERQTLARLNQARKDVLRLLRSRPEEWQVYRSEQQNGMWTEFGKEHVLLSIEVIDQSRVRVNLVCQDSTRLCLIEQTGDAPRPETEEIAQRVRDRYVTMQLELAGLIAPPPPPDQAIRGIDIQGGS